MPVSTSDADKWIAQLLECKHLSESEMKALCDRVRTILMEESNIQPVSTPVTIVATYMVSSGTWSSC